MDDFERELKQAMERRPAPPSLKRRILQQRSKQRTQQVHSHAVLWQRLAASLVLAGVLGGGYGWRQHQERRKGEEAARQVWIALRITNHALNDMNSRLATRGHDNQQ
jgi:hypothetical protein